MSTPTSVTRPAPHLDAPPIATVLTRDERMRVDAAGQGLYATLHRDSVEQVLRDLRRRPVAGVLVSVGRCDARETATLARVVREFPRVPTYALLSQIETATPGAVLSLGGSGVRTLIDVRQPTGWRELRDALIADRASDIQRVALGQLALDLAGAPEPCYRFFELLFGRPAPVRSVRALANALGALPTTLMSRFFRARLPAPKRYLALARLVQAAWLFENPGLSIANVADHLDYSSPQSFGRHVRTLMGMTASAFRARYDGEGMLCHFRDALILPHQATLRTFSPVAVPRTRPVVADAAAPVAPFASRRPVRQRRAMAGAAG
jgi:AraC-like DNA-binding protein